MLRESYRTSNSNLFSLSGGLAMLFSIVLALPVLFSPIACSFVGSLELVMLGLVFLAGAGVFLVGRVLRWKQNRPGAGTPRN